MKIRLGRYVDGKLVETRALGDVGPMGGSVPIDPPLTSDDEGDWAISLEGQPSLQIVPPGTYDRIDTGR